jgi:hypothetical protein
MWCQQALAVYLSYGDIIGYLHAGCSRLARVLFRVWHYLRGSAEVRIVRLSLKKYGGEVTSEVIVQTRPIIGQSGHQVKFQPLLHNSRRGTVA